MVWTHFESDIWTLDNRSLDYRLFKFVNKTEEPRQFRKGADGAKVVLLSNVNESANVVDAVLLDTGDALPKRKFSIENEMSEMTLSAATNSDYVYDMYRIDLGRYSEADIKANMVGIVSYEQELVNENECADSDVYENEDDSNGKAWFIDRTLTFICFCSRRLLCQ